MLQVKFRREGKSASLITKSATNLIESRATECSINTSTSLIPPQQHHVVSRGLIGQPFTIRVNMGNIPSTPENQLSFSSSKVDDLKAVNAKKICDSVGELKKALSIFRYLEKDDDKCKGFIFHWFHQAETAFLNVLNGQLNKQAAQALVQSELQAKNNRFLMPVQDTKSVSFSYSKPLPEISINKEIESLQLEVQTYKKNSIQAMGKIESIMKMVEIMQGRLQVERKENKALLSTANAYSDESDYLLEKINTKYQREKKISVLEREIQQVLTKLKFKTFNYTNRS